MNIQVQSELQCNVCKLEQGFGRDNAHMPYLNDWNLMQRALNHPLLKIHIVVKRLIFSISFQMYNRRMRISYNILIVAINECSNDMNYLL